MSSRERSLHDFGLLIAYLLPGFTVLWGASPLVPLIENLIFPIAPDAPTLGGFLLGTIAALAVGLFISTVRWAVIDTLHHHTGIPAPKWNFASLQHNIAAFSVLIDIHYRYYQFYAGMVISLFVVLFIRRFDEALGWLQWTWVDAGIIVGIVLFYIGSRDTLRKYFMRTEQLLAMEHTSQPRPQRGTPNRTRNRQSKKDGGGK